MVGAGAAFPAACLPTSFDPAGGLQITQSLILTLQTTTFSTYGGIPTYNRLVCRVLNDFEGPSAKQVLIMTDTSPDLSGHHGELSNLQLRAFSSKRRAFGWQVLQLGLTRRIDLALIGHVNYAPLGWMLKQLQP